MTHPTPPVAIVTGGAGYIGQAIATGLAADGHAVAIADLDQARGISAAIEGARPVVQARVLADEPDVVALDSLAADEALEVPGGAGVEVAVVHLLGLRAGFSACLGALAAALVGPAPAAGRRGGPAAMADAAAVALAAAARDGV